MRLSLFSSKQCIIKQLLDSVFVISGIIKVSVSVISLSLRLRLITLTSTLIIPDITKTSSNNCLLLRSSVQLIVMLSYLGLFLLASKKLKGLLMRLAIGFITSCILSAYEMKNWAIENKAYLKGLYKSEEEWHFPFCNISSRSRDIQRFCIMQIRYWWRHKVWQYRSQNTK